ncbi:MAG: TetR/AcrR family transcriptional regulator, partial [Acidimicrobiia bacterium]|nr:TetR/AcrR family transcriptional regulator [Acidimicrobiia bacterium]
MTTPLTTAAPASRRRAAPLPPEERRASIIEAVLPLLMEQGAAVTSRQLAAAAGVSEGTIFNAFGDKEALLAAVLAAAVDTAPFERAIAAIGSELPFEERLAEAVVLIQRRIADI